MQGSYQSKISNLDEIKEIRVTSERRSHDREISILRLAKIESGKAQGWGLVRNVSSSGMMLDIHPSFHLTDTITIALTEHHQLKGTVRWHRDSSVGIQFIDVLDVPDLLASALAHKNGQRTRLPRIHIKYPIKLMTGTKLISAEIQDISPGGLCIKSDYIFEPGKQLTLTVPQLGDITAIVRWQSGTNVGLAFCDRISIASLMTWLSTYHDTCSNSGEAPITEQLKAPAYFVVGYDDLGKQVKIATVHSADEAMVHQKASSTYFYRVTVTEADGTEIFPGMLMQRSFQEQNMAKTDWLKAGI